MFNIAWIKTKDKKQLDLIVEMLTKLYDKQDKKIDEDLLNRISEFGSKEIYHMSSEERENYVAEVSVAFEKVIKPKIDKLIYQQKEYIAVEGLKEEYDFDRGTMNGIMSVMEEFEKDHLEHLDNIKPKEGFDKEKMFNELVE